MSPVKLLGGLRIVVGVSAFFTPGVAAKLFGMSLASSPQAGYMARLFGIRDVIMGVLLLTGSEEVQQAMIKTGVVADAGDVLSAKLEHRAGRISTSTAVLGGLTAAAATGMGVVAATGAGGIDDTSPAL